jgi:hypothetical protein
MSEFGEKRVVVCPVCNGEVLADKVTVHFSRIHRRDLPVAELLEILAQAKARPVDEKEYYANLDEQEKKEHSTIERTPRPMQQWEGGTPREGMQSGPLGPETR